MGHGHSSEQISEQTWGSVSVTRAARNPSGVEHYA
ncbi:uncharacterized protein METZ01_LOCUS58168 [marine metagenome]|uniref:Uncharacterized protein n=1 Tax=marine metagenome TaxID=408172 RepID=A0A381SPH5_9ZZZZ